MQPKPSPIKDIQSPAVQPEVQQPAPSAQTVADPQSPESEVPETTKTENGGDNIGLAVGIAVMIAMVLVLFGVLAYRYSDLSTDLGEDRTATSAENEADATSTESGMQAEFDSLSEELDSLEDEPGVEETDLSDQALELE